MQRDSTIVVLIVSILHFRVCRNFYWNIFLGRQILQQQTLPKFREIYQTVERAECLKDTDIYHGQDKMWQNADMLSSLVFGFSSCPK